MNKYLKSILDFLFYAVVTVVISLAVIIYLEKQNPWNGLYYLFTPYAAILSGIIGTLIGLKWELKWPYKLLISILLIVPSYALVMLVLTRVN